MFQCGTDNLTYDVENKKVLNGVTAIGDKMDTFESVFHWSIYNFHILSLIIRFSSSPELKQV